MVKQNGKVVDSRRYKVTPSISDLEFELDDSEPIHLLLTDDFSRDFILEVIGDGSSIATDVLTYLEGSLVSGSGYAVAWLSDSPDEPSGYSYSEKLTRRNICMFHLFNDGSGHYYRDWGQFMYNERADMTPGEAEDDAFGSLLYVRLNFKC